tara:strand:+ start:1370 stop:1765 length:396 start_codon:yes stop_codon:yes gene_type:complete
MSMLWKNECNHPEEDYLFTMEVDGQMCDVWFYRHSLGDENEFCLRYGNEDHEYKSSWDCSLIERIISRRTRYLKDDESGRERRDIDQLIKLKEKLKELGYWDITWSLDPEIQELRATLDNYNDSCRVVVIG